jgi:hypothetical protein
MKIKKPHMNIYKLKKLVTGLRKPTRRQLKFIAPIAVVAIVAISFATFKAVGTPDTTGNGDHAAHDAHKQQLLSQVGNTDGTPRDGRDPANQKQGSLAAAASSPNGPSRNTDSSTSEDDGLNSAGCYYEYGNGGQCVPAHAATNGKLTCEGVTTHGGFKDGVTYSKDRFGLDKNKNGTACDPGDF